MLFRVGVVLALKCRIHLQSSTSSSCFVAAAWQQLRLPHRGNTGLKANAGLADIFFSTEKVTEISNGAKKQSLHDDTQ